MIKQFKCPYQDFDCDKLGISNSISCTKCNHYNEAIHLKSINMPKDKIINFKIEDEIKKEFEALCKELYTTSSHELRLFVRQFIKRNKGSKILLSNLNQTRQ